MMNKAELIAFAKDRSLDAEGTRRQLEDRLRSAGLLDADGNAVVPAEPAAFDEPPVPSAPPSPRAAETPDPSTSQVTARTRPAGPPVPQAQKFTASYYGAVRRLRPSHAAMFARWAAQQGGPLHTIKEWDGIHSRFLGSPVTG